MFVYCTLKHKHEQVEDTNFCNLVTLEAQEEKVDKTVPCSLNRRILIVILYAIGSFKMAAYYPAEQKYDKVIKSIGRF